LSVIGFAKPVVTDVLNAPFLFATDSQAIATKVFIVLKYIGMLFWPFNLSSDYGYNQIPYVELTSIKFIMSAIILSGLLIYAFYRLRNRSLFSFAILFFFITISVATNFIIDIGTPFSERLLFQPSLAFCIALAFLLIKLNEKRKFISPVILMVVFLFFSVKTMSRNREWKNNTTLFLKDVITSPNSARINWGVMEIYRAKAEGEGEGERRANYLNESIKYGKRSLIIYPDFPAAYISLGFPYYYLYQYDTAADLWLHGFRLDSTSKEARECLRVLSEVYSNHGKDLLQGNQVNESILALKKAVELNGKNSDAWENLGKAYFLVNDSAEGEKALSTSNILKSNAPPVVK
jgi:protein O-mannosyl-transferase